MLPWLLVGVATPLLVRVISGGWRSGAHPRARSQPGWRSAATACAAVVTRAAALTSSCLRDGDSPSDGGAREPLARPSQPRVRQPIPAARHSSGSALTTFAVVLSGPPGSGKSSVLTALADALSDDEVAHAALDVEALGWVHPAASDDQRSRYIAALCDLHRDAGHRLLLVADTVETEADLARLLASIGADEYLLVRLEAGPATLRKRISEREPETWSGLLALLEHATALAATMPALEGFDLVLGTDAERPEAIADRIRAARPGQRLL